MAAPCLNGAIGLLWSAIPRLRRQIDETISLLRMASRETSINNTCNSEGSPNNLVCHCYFEFVIDCKPTNSTIHICV